MTREDHGMYGIGTAARLSGVHGETIRMWERRYRLPRPARSEGGHRKYSDHDIALLKAIKRLLDGGARIGAVAEMSEDDILSAAAGLDDAAAGDWGEAIERTIDAAKKRDTRRAEELLDRPLLQRHAVEVVTEFYLPLMKRVGDAWFAGEVDVAAEHFVEKLVSGRIHAVLANRRTQTGAARVVCACPPSERHEVGLLAASLALKDAGFEVVHLGADVPVKDLVATLKTRPRLLVLAATIEPTDATVDALAKGLEPFDELTVVVGGAASAALQRALGRRCVRLPDIGRLVAFARALPTAA